MSPLAPCPSCRRHVRVAESACPFCGTAVVLEAASAPRAAQRLGRAAIFTFGAVAIATSAGCSTSTTPPTDDVGHDAYYGSIGDVYGAPALDTNGPFEDVGTDSGLSAAYGGPPVDAALEDSGTSALYGAPPPPPEP